MQEVESIKTTLDLTEAYVNSFLPVCAFVPAAKQRKRKNGHSTTRRKNMYLEGLLGMVRCCSPYSSSHDFLRVPCLRLLPERVRMIDA